MEWLILIINGLGFPTIIAIIIITMNRHEKRTEKAQCDLARQWTHEKEYNDATGNLVEETARALKRNDVCDGELDEPIRLYAEAKINRAKFYREKNGEMATKGG